MGRLLARVYRKFFWRAYDNIGRMLALNLLWFVIFPVVTYLCFRWTRLEGLGGAAVTVLVGLLTASYAGAGVFALTARIARREEDGRGTHGGIGESGGPGRSGGIGDPDGGGAGGAGPSGSGDIGELGRTGGIGDPDGSGGPGAGWSLDPSVTPRAGLLHSFFTQAWRYLPRMAVLGLVFGGLIALLFHSIRFYAGFGGSGGIGGGILGFFLAGVQIWILAFCLLMQVYAFPLLYLKNWGVRRILKWSAILVILRPGLTVLVFIQAFALFGLLTFTGVGFVLLAYSHTALFLNVAVLEVLKEMEDKWITKKGPTSWREIMAERDAAADEDADEKRTLRDILRPWE